MKLLLLGLFVAAVASSPVPDDSGPIDVVVNGVPEGEPLDVSQIINIKVKEHGDDGVVVSDVLHPFTAQGLAEAAAALEEAKPEVAEPIPSPVVPEVPAPIILPEVNPVPIVPEVPVPIILPEVKPEPIVPEAPESVIVVNPEESVIVVEGSQPAPEPIVLPPPQTGEPIRPEVPIVVMPEKPEVVITPEQPEVVPEILPVPAAQGEVYNDGLVQIAVNHDNDSNLMSTLQSWFNMVVNYIQSGSTQSMQIV